MCIFSINVLSVGDLPNVKSVKMLAKRPWDTSVSFIQGRKNSLELPGRLNLDHFFCACLSKSGRPEAHLSLTPMCQNARGSVGQIPYYSAHSFALLPKTPSGVGDEYSCEFLVEFALFTVFEIRS